MNKLVLQVIIRQWDKPQLSEQHTQARQLLADRDVISPSALVLYEGLIHLDQHGDDVLGNRLHFQLVDNCLLIDRFRFSLDRQTVEFKAKLEAEEPPILLTTLNEGWLQCQYQWRYRIEEGGFIYWLYEQVTLNACFVENVDANIFMGSLPKQNFHELL